MKGPALVLHGGAGDFSNARILAGRVDEMRRDLGAALDAGTTILSRGGAALEAVVAAVSVLEDSHVFNAARGAVLRRDGSVRLDASVMCGVRQRAGAVCLLRRVQNPVQLARAVLEREQEVLLCGEEADELAGALGLSLQPPEYFVTDYRRKQLERLLERGGADSGASAGRAGTDSEEEGQTVGAVALDQAGHLAAATSTGGRTHARVSRIGDSPVLGAGTWASDQSCAVSATGAGEFFLRTAFAHEVHARLTWQGLSLNQAARQALHQVVQLGGEGGCVAIDREGNIAMPFTTSTMPRACQDRAGQRSVWVLERGELDPG